jgi:lipopolysaccharide export system protein LptA
MVKIFLHQGVEFTDLDRKGNSQDLEMNLAENKITMRGQPRVQMGEDEIKGHEIIFFNGGKTVKVNNNINSFQGDKR